uniref:MAM domain-containing protein n=1 Tax=Strigamia maritima TaxID=126957 RepID=T1JPK7_STRMM
MCLFSQSPKTKYTGHLLKRKNRSLFPEDHTTNTLDGGNYLYLNTTSKSVDDHATLISPWLPAGKHCTHFWFYSTSVGAVLNIHKLKHGNAEEPLATFESIRQYSWLSASVEANDSSTIEISFEAIPGPRESNLVFALDDIDFTPGSCSSRNFCDFEKDLCFWQIDDDSDIKWERSNGYEIRKTITIICRIIH